jgi:hypothetical protein
MNEGTNDPATVPILATEAPASETPAPATAPPPPAATPAPASENRVALWLIVGSLFGTVLGSLLTTTIFTTYLSYTRTLPGGRDSLQVFNELNDLRQQLNKLNADNKLKELEKVNAVRESLGAIAAAARTPETKPAATPDKKVADKAMPPAPKREGPFADIDAEIERLENTQKVLNTILDVFTAKKEKDR